MQAKHVALLFVAFIVGGVIIFGESPEKSDEADSQSSSAPTCEEDYTACATLQEAIDNNDRIKITAASRCKIAAEDAAKYGEPEWPWLTFSAARRSQSDLADGRVALVETDAKFQNGFGAMKKVVVVCHYDLIGNEVTKLNVIE